jgi:hypothetical protein
MGTLQDAFGIVAAFQAMGILAIAWAAALWPLHRWAFRHGRPA